MNLIRLYLAICIVAPLLNNERSRPTQSVDVCQVCMVRTKRVDMVVVW